MWERAFRRVNLPVAYSNGFSPRPRVSFGLALSTGYESVAEYLDVELSDSPPGCEASRPDLDGLTAGLSAALPEGVDVLAIAASNDRSLSLQEEVTACTWRLAVAHIQPPDPSAGAAGAAVGGRLSRLLAADSMMITRSRKGRVATEDIRPAILAVRLLDEREGLAELECELATQPRSLRPTELVAALGADLEERDVRRLHQWIERDGARCEPLVAAIAATDAPHAHGRAS